MFARLLKALLRRVRGPGSGDGGPSLGPWGEELAYWHLRERGFTMVARNYRRAGVGGEVDLIGWDAGTLVFVEVKTRRSPEFRQAEDAVDSDKRRHLIAAGRDYLRRARVTAPHRFDIVSVYPQSSGEPAIQHFRDAFSEAEADAGAAAPRG